MGIVFSSVGINGHLSLLVAKDKLLYKSISDEEVYELMRSSSVLYCKSK